MLHKQYLNKQIEDNKIKRIKQHINRDRDEWNTLELKGYNDEVLARTESRSNTKKSQIQKSNSVVPKDWHDTSLKYIQKDLDNSNVKMGDSVKTPLNKSTDATVQNKHFLYPLLNKSKRLKFKKNMEVL